MKDENSQKKQRETMGEKNNNEKLFTWRFINIMLVDLLQRICTYMLVPLLPLYMIDRGFSIAVAGLTTSVYMLVAVAFRPIAGKIVDTRGRYLVAILGTLVYLVASGFFSAGIPVWLFLIMRGLQGLGFCFVGTALMTLATDIIPKGRMSEGIGYLGLTQTISRAFFPIVALAIKDAFGYQVTFWVIFWIAALDVLVGLTLGWARKMKGVCAPDLSSSQCAAVVKSVSPSPDRIKEPFWEKLVDRDALKPSTIMLFFIIATSCIQTFIVVHATAKGIINPGVFFTANAIAIAVARLSVGKIEQKFGSVAVLVPGMAFASLSMVAMYSSANVAILITSGALYGLAMGMVQPSLNSLSVLLARKEHRGLANSTFFMAMDLGNAVGAYAMGVLAGYTGLGSIYLTGAALAAIPLIGCLLLNQKGFLRSPGLQEVD
jgi:MFS family permease